MHQHPISEVVDDQITDDVIPETPDESCIAVETCHSDCCIRRGTATDQRHGIGECLTAPVGTRLHTEDEIENGKADAGNGRHGRTVLWEAVHAFHTGE